MKALIAGVGNIFLTDDGFGPAVLEQLAGRTWPAGVTATDFGIRGVHLAYELLDGYDVLIVVDAAPRGSAAGTVSPRSQADCVGEHLPPSTVGRTEPGPDGVSIKIVAPKPGGTAAHETDGPVE